MRPAWLPPGVWEPCLALSEAEGLLVSDIDCGALPTGVDTASK